jgi:hypothetical protein
MYNDELSAIGRILDPYDYSNNEDDMFCRYAWHAWQQYLKGGKAKVGKRWYQRKETLRWSTALTRGKCISTILVICNYIAPINPGFY